MLVRFGLEQEAAGLQVFDDLLAGFIAVHAAVHRHIGGDVRVSCQHVDDGQSVPQTDLEVVRIVSRCDLHDAGPEIPFDIGVRDDRDLLVHQRQDDGLADQVLIALVLRMDRHGGVAEQRLRAGRRQVKPTAAIRQRITDVIERALGLLILDLGVGNRRQAGRAPVDDPFATVDQALFIQADEHLRDRLRQHIVHGEAFTAPVAGRSEALQLLDDPAAIDALPFPGSLQKSLAADCLLVFPVFPHLLDDFRLGRDRGVVGAGQPEGGIALHPLLADQDVLQGVVEGVPHVQLTGDVRRRDHDGVGFFRRVGLGREIALFLPVCVQAGFCLGWLESLADGIDA